jgi:hypothetical protein
VEEMNVDNDLFKQHLLELIEDDLGRASLALTVWQSTNRDIPTHDMIFLLTMFLAGFLRESTTEVNREPALNETINMLRKAVLPTRSDTTEPSDNTTNIISITSKLKRET